MPTRVQNITFALGSAKQVDVATISPSFNTWRKLNMDIPFLMPGTETDKDEIGKGNEFITQVFKTATEPVGQRIEKHGSAEFTLWAWAYALGVVGLSSGLYTINPLDPANTIELPYFSIAVKAGEGGGTAFNEAHIGNNVESVETSFHYGPGRASFSTNVEYVGNGISTIPSGISFPVVLAENYILGSSAAITVNGIDYVAGTPGAKTILMGSMSWRNNIILPLRYFPGSGINSDGFAVGGRSFYGNRVPGFTFTVFLTKDSDEYAKLVAQTTGTAVLTFTFDATHFVTFTYHSVSYEMVARTQEEGIIAVSVTVAPKFHASQGVLTVTGKCGVADLCQ